MPKTGENIYERKDGRFEARYIAGRDEDGKAVYKSVYGYSKAEVREKAETARRESCGETLSNAGKTFREVAEEWLESIRGSMAATTWDRYADTLSRDIYPEYADTPINDVTEKEINRFLKLAPELAEKRGRTLKNSSLQAIKAVMSNIIKYVRVTEGNDGPDMPGDVDSYEELTPQELELVCIKANYNHCPEMLSSLLSIYCGMRIGELCALKSDDVDCTRNEIYIHEITHRVKNPKRDEEGQSKTIVIVEEIPRKKQIRRVSFPPILSDYIAEFISPGKTLIRNKDDGLMDPRTLENWLNRIMSVFRVQGINFERYRKTYMNGKADEQVLNNTFLGIRPESPYGGHVDVKWLSDEMAKDLAPLRMLLGLSIEEMAAITGMSEGMYRQMENGSRELSWDQYMTILFMYHYNMRTSGIVDILGLYPDSLKEKIRIG